jgi:predicted permease
MDGTSLEDAVQVQDFPIESDQMPDLRRYEWILPGFHETLNVEVLAGRTINWADIHDRNKVVVLSESLARCYWDRPEEAIGKRVREAPSSPWREVVGVVADVRSDGVGQDAPPTVYWPMLVEGFWGEETWVPQRMAYVIRTPRVGSESLMNEVRQAVWSVNPKLPLANVTILEALIDRSMARTSFTLVMLCIAAVVALLLGAVGIYGVIAYTVSLRTREFGVRMALGARRCDVSGMVVRHGLILAGAGIVLGLTVAAALTRLMSTLLYGISPTDPLTFGFVAATLVAVAAVASFMPAWRASRIDPITALRWE